MTIRHSLLTLTLYIELYDSGFNIVAVFHNNCNIFDTVYYNSVLTKMAMYDK